MFGEFCSNLMEINSSAVTHAGQIENSRPTRPAAKRARRPATLILKLLLFLALGWVCGAGKSAAQELTRDSLAGADAGQSSGSAGDPNYNLQLGPVRFLLDANAGFEYIDNISYSEHNRESDEVVRIGLNIRSIYQLTKLNTIQLDLGVGFVRYLEHPDATNNDVFITPGSQVALNVYVADMFRINVHDSFAILQDPVDQPNLSNVTDFGRFTNTAGVTVVGDFNTLVLTAGYDHFNYVSLNSEYDFLNRSSEAFLASAVYKVAPRTFVGIEGNVALTDYDQDVQNDSTGASVGGYFDITFNPYIRLIARGGYQYASFKHSYEEFNEFSGDGSIFPNGTHFGDDEELSDFYWNISINHRINAYLTQSVTAGRENDLGLTSNYITENFVRYNIAWRALNSVTVGGDAFYENDQESGGLFDEHLQRFGATGTLGYQFNLQVSASVYYGYLRKDSDTADRSYYQNTAGVNVDYKF